MKVLVADDNADNRRLLADILRGSGYEPLVARDGEEALSTALENTPDLIILDINMPGINGFEVCARLKENADTSQIPILMLTAMGDIEYRVRGLGLGADDYLTKPYSPRELMARIDARLRIKSKTDQLRATQERIRRTFERFVPAHVVDQLLENPQQAQLGGQLREITILFADLEGFTPIAEYAAPDHLLDVLNKYHNLMVHHILQEHGTIDKFIGDGVMALYNTPLPQDNHELRAVRAAVNIQRALPEFHQQFEQVFRLPVNFGIHTGEALVGNVGTAEIMDYTAIGDSVNLASRLQEMSKGGQILVSEATLQKIEQSVNAHSLGPHMIRGRETPVTIYEILELQS